MTLCGIPEVTLLGTVADWTDVHTRFLALADTWMHCTPETSGWVKDVDAFLKQFIAARSGKGWQARCRSDSLASSTSFFAGHVDAAWWVSLFTYNGARGSGSSPYVTGHINVLFPWNRVGKDKFEWLGSRKVIKSFPDGMNCVPLLWNYHGEEHPMKAWAGSLCPCISEDGCEVAPATCVGFTIDAPKEELDDTAAKVSAHHRSCPALCHDHTRRVCIVILAATRVSRLFRSGR
jgi:hypothetical protein